MIHKMCRNCGSSFPQFNTLQTICGKCIYNRTQKPKKPIKKIGKITKKWIEFRNRWIIDHPPNHEGNYACGICGKAVHINEVTLDHIIPRSARPDLRFEDSNIQPAHNYCNSLKGSSRIPVDRFIK